MSECVFSMEEYVLLKSYIASCQPEAAIFGEVVFRNLYAGHARFVEAFFYIKVSYIDAKGAWFLRIHSAIANACGPDSGFFAFVILVVVAKYASLSNRNEEICAINFRLLRFFASVSLVVVNTQFSYFQISLCLGVEAILLFKPRGRPLRELTKASFEIYSALIVFEFSAIKAIAIEPSNLLSESYIVTTKSQTYIVTKLMMNDDTIHGNICIRIAFQIDIASAQTAAYICGIVNLCFCIDTNTTGVFVCRRVVCVVVLITHTSIAVPRDVADFLFEIGNANAEVCEFVSIFASEFVNGCLLLCIQLVFFCHEASNDLSQFVTGHILFAFEGAVRIAFYDALSGQVGYCLISPVISGDIGKRICSVSGYASGECCYSSQCEDLFHNKSLLKKT